MFAQDYRPKKFSEVVGQELPVATLKSIAMTDKFPLRALLLQGAYGTGKCVPAGTRVAVVNKGYVSIESLYPNPEEGFNDYVTQIITRQGNKPTSHFYYEKLAPVITLTLSNGTKVRGTAKHRIMAQYFEDIEDEIVEVASPSMASFRMMRLAGEKITEDLSITEPMNVTVFAQGVQTLNQVSDINIREIVGVSSQASSQEVPVEEIQGLFPMGLMQVGTKVLLSTKQLEFGTEQPKANVLGLFYGMGGMHSTASKYFFLGNQEQCEAFAEQAGWSGPIVYTEKWGIPQHGVGPLLTDNVDYLPESADVFPEWIFNADANSRWEFIRGLASSGAIEVEEDEFILKTASKVLAEAVHTVFTTLGRVPSIKEYPNCYVVKAKRTGEITGDFVEYESTHNPYEDPYVVVTVAEISRTEEAVYDLTVPEFEEFYAQGTFNHNTTLSRIFAKAVNCEHFKKTGEVCNECEACKEADRQGSLSYREYDATRVGSVDAIKSLIDSLQIRNFEGRRVVCIDEVHACSKQAQSALLKVLEEGIPDTLFVFATTDNVLKTIESRSVRLDFFPLQHEAIVKRLKEVASAEGISITEDQYDAIAFKSQGHMRNALSILEHFSIAGDEAIKTPQQEVKNFFKFCLQKKPVDDTILAIMQYPLLDVQAAIRDFIIKCYKATDGFEGKIRQKGLSFQIFKFFYTPEAQQAFHDEVGMEILLRAFAEQLQR